jgi:hypothetical protein
MKGGCRPFKLPPLPPAKLGRDFHENGGPCPRSPQGPGDTTATREIPTLLSLLLQSNPRRRPVKGTLRAPRLSRTIERPPKAAAFVLRSRQRRDAKPPRRPGKVPPRSALKALDRLHP